MISFVDLFFFGVLGTLMVLDFTIPARTFRQVRFWRLKGTISIALYYLISSYSPFIWDGFLSRYQLIDGSQWPLWIAAPVALLVYQLGIYLWHRTMHATPFLWYWFHQMHHSAERVDIWGALYFHPLDMVAFTFVGSLALTLVLGVDPVAILFAFLFSTFCGLFQHANLKTPRWLGYFIARPESHALHHETGVHRYNYGDIPIWDIIFGTFRNPESWDGEAGLGEGVSEKYLSLLFGRDVEEKARKESPVDVAGITVCIGAFLLTATMVSGLVWWSFGLTSWGPYLV